MITQINLRHFKCFDSLELPLRSLTLLSGPNARGKSAVIQSLVLLNQTICNNEWSPRLLLNGNIIRLGTASDVVDHVSGQNDFYLGLIGKEHSYYWRFQGERDDMSMRIAHVDVDGETQPQNDAFRNLLPYSSSPFELTSCLKNLTYLNTERLGPRELYSLEDSEDVQIVGPNGEYAASILYKYQDSTIESSLVNSSVPPTLLNQVEVRMAELFPGCRLETKKVSQVNAVTLSLRTSNSTRFHRPINTGFGLTQVLPIIVSALFAKPGDLLLIENPEVHMHPAGQARIGELLAQVAATGVQVIVETHSDHLLNGIRRAVKQSLLPYEDVVLHFFRPRMTEADQNTSQVESPSIGSDGNIDYWPNGFFDQFDNDMNYFAGWD